MKPALQIMMVDDKSGAAFEHCSARDFYRANEMDRGERRAFMLEMRRDGRALFGGGAAPAVWIVPLPPGFKHDPATCPADAGGPCTCL